MARVAVAERTTVARAVVGWADWRSRLPQWTPAALVGLLALALNLFRLGAPSLWMDEAFSVQLARQPLPVLFGAFTSGGEPNMLLYHLLLHGWLDLGAAFGIPASEVFVRFPSAVAGALSVVMVYALGRRFLGQTAALAGAAIYLFSGAQLTYAQQARSYALQVLLICLSWYALLAALRSRGRAWRWWALYIAVTALSVYAHAFSLLLVLGQVAGLAVLLVWRNPWRVAPRERIAPVMVSLAAVGVLVAPFVLVSRHGSKTGWLPTPSISGLAGHALGDKGGLLVAVGASVLLVLAAVILLFMLPWGRGVRLRLAERVKGTAGEPALGAEAAPVVALLMCWLVVPVVASYAVSLGPLHLFSTRYLVTVVPALALLAGALVASFRWPVVRLALGGVFVAAMLVTVPGYYMHAESENWRDPVRWLEHEYRPGDVLVSYDNVQGVELPVDYYLQTDGNAARIAPNAPGAVRLGSFATGGDPFAGFAQALDSQALATYTQGHPRLFFIEGRFKDAADAARAHATQAWLDTHYRLVAQTTDAVVTIRLYDTSAAE